MNAMARMAADENAAVWKSWKGEVLAELPALPVKANQGMPGILSDVCEEAGFKASEVLGLSGKINGFKARARMQAIRQMAASGHSNRAICDFLGMKIRSVQHVVRTVTHNQT